MPKAVLYVESRPVSPEREDEYSRWYDEVHLGEVVALGGVTGARRYKAPDGTYVAMYDIEAEDPKAVVKALGAGIRDGRVVMSDVLQMDPPPVMRVLEQITEHRS
jgi:hypothetical protein